VTIALGVRQRDCSTAVVQDGKSSKPDPRWRNRRSSASKLEALRTAKQFIKFMKNMTIKPVQI
jgi:hypothetical protein